ncbi:MAG: PepSY domain-containing protein [Candidatus Competibacter sp.]|nr:PepSY domain-containing protein [Candidatus Competibacteraceae bacterium]
MKLRTVLPTAALLTIVSFSGGVAAAESQSAAPAAQPAPAAAAQDITKEQAVEMALKAHPGKVTKAYEDTKKGKKTWEVKIDGADGKKWEVYYEIKTGQLIAEEGK